MKQSYLLSTLSFCIVILSIIIYSTNFVYDEPYYFENLSLIKKYGIGSDFITNMKGPAGPLHAYFYYIYQFIARDSVITTRLLNPILSIGVVILLNKTLRLVNAPLRNGIHLYLIPMSFTSIGLALTETPALFMFSAALYLISYISIGGNLMHKHAVIITSGLLFSLSVIGRQPYLVCLIGLAYMLFNSKYKLETKPLYLFAISSLSVPLYCFYLWSGLAPKIGGDIATENILSPIHYFIGCGYAAFTMLCICPQFYPRFNMKQMIIHCIVFIISLTSIILMEIQFSYGMLSIKKLFPHELRHLIDPTLLAALITIGSIFIHGLFIRMKENMNNVFFIGASIMLLCLLISNISITHLFSNRYVFQAAPMFIILSSYYYKPTKWNYMMHIIGLIIGIRGLYHFI